MNQKKKTIVLWGVIIVLAAAVVALSVILVTKSRKNNDPDGQKNAGTEAVIEGSGQDAEQKAEDGADQKKEKGASDTQKWMNLAFFASNSFRLSSSSNLPWSIIPTSSASREISERI